MVKLRLKVGVFQLCFNIVLASKKQRSVSESAALGQRKRSQLSELQDDAVHIHRFVSLPPLQSRCLPPQLIHLTRRSQIATTHTSQHRRHDRRCSHRFPRPLRTLPTFTTPLLLLLHLSVIHRSSKRRFQCQLTGVECQLVSFAGFGVGSDSFAALIEFGCERQWSFGIFHLSISIASLVLGFRCCFCPGCRAKQIYSATTAEKESLTGSPVYEFVRGKAFRITSQHFASCQAKGMKS